MEDEKPVKPLTPEQKVKIYAAIGMAMLYNDMSCEEVIEKYYNGDEEAFLRQNAIDHNIPLD